MRPKSHMKKTPITKIIRGIPLWLNTLDTRVLQTDCCPWYCHIWVTWPEIETTTPLHGTVAEIRLDKYIYISLKIHHWMGRHLTTHRINGLTDYLANSSAVWNSLPASI